jgi:hypothetical protein
VSSLCLVPLTRDGILRKLHELRTGGPVDAEVLIEWIDRAGTELPVECLSDDEVLALCQCQLDAGQQEELSDLLAGNREGVLQDAERRRLDELMRVYRRGLVRKAQALKTAVARGLKPRLD